MSNQKEWVEKVKQAIQNDDGVKLSEQLKEFKGSGVELDELVPLFLEAVRGRRWGSVETVLNETELGSRFMRVENKFQFEDAVNEVPVEQRPENLAELSKQLKGTEEMIRAIEGRDLERVKQLLSEGVKVDHDFAYNNRNGETFSLLSIRANAPEILKELNKHGVPNPFVENVLENAKELDNPFAILNVLKMQAYSNSDESAAERIQKMYITFIEEGMLSSSLSQAYLFRELPEILKTDQIVELVKKGLPLETQYGDQVHTLAHGLVDHVDSPEKVKEFLNELTGLGFDLNKPDYSGKGLLDRVNKGFPRYKNWQEGVALFLQENPGYGAEAKPAKDRGFKP